MPKILLQYPLLIKEGESQQIMVEGNYDKNENNCILNPMLVICLGALRYIPPLFSCFGICFMGNYIVHAALPSVFQLGLSTGRHGKEIGEQVEETKEIFTFSSTLGNISTSGYFSSMTLVFVWQTCHGSGFLQLIYVSGFQ